MRVVCWNVNGLGPTIPNIKLKYGGLHGLFHTWDADAVCFQEAKLPQNRLTREIVCVEGYESLWAVSREKPGYSGVTTYVRQSYSPVAAEVDCLSDGSEDIDREGRIVLTDLGEVVLINVYVPNAGDHPARARLPFKLRFLHALREKMDCLVAQGRHVVVVGDFNIALEPRDVHPTFTFDKLYSAEEGRWLQAATAAFPDTWRRLHPGATGCYTVWDEKTSARAFNAGLRIDFALISPSLLPRLVSCEILLDLPPKWSDHAPLLLELRDVPIPPKHPPCPLSSLRMKAFNDSSQPSIASMFARKRPAAGGSSSRGAGQGKAGGGEGPLGVGAPGLEVGGGRSSVPHAGSAGEGVSQAGGLDSGGGELLREGTVDGGGGSQLGKGESQPEHDMGRADGSGVGASAETDARSPEGRSPKRSRGAEGGGEGGDVTGSRDGPRTTAGSSEGGAPVRAVRAEGRVRVAGFEVGLEAGGSGAPAIPLGSGKFAAAATAAGPPAASVASEATADTADGVQVAAAAVSARAASSGGGRLGIGGRGTVSVESRAKVGKKSQSGKSQSGKAQPSIKSFFSSKPQQ